MTISWLYSTRFQNDSVVAGGGAIEMELSKYLRDYSRTIPGKQQLLIGAYAKALEIIPRQLCDNAGFDATNILNKLRAKHAQVGWKNTLSYSCTTLRKSTRQRHFKQCAFRWLYSLLHLSFLVLGWYVVRRGHQQRGHSRQLRGLCLGAVHRADQRSDSSVWGRLPHPVGWWDDQEPPQLYGRTSRRRQGQRSW